MNPANKSMFHSFKIIAYSVACLFMLSTFSACSTFNCTRLENIVGSDTDLIAFSYTVAEELTVRAMPPLVPRHPDMPVLITTFVDNNDLKQTSQFGRIMQDHVASRLVQLGYSVKEIKLANNLQIEQKSGETILSRDLKKLSSSQKAQAILVGTISYINRTMYVSTRLINPINSNIISSADYRLCMDDNILAMLGLQRHNGMDSGVEMIEEPSQPFLNSIL